MLGERGDPRPYGVRRDGGGQPLQTRGEEGVRERVRRRTYRSRDEARQDVFDYIEMFYNPIRKHVRNGMLSLVEFERQQTMSTEGV